MKKIILMAMVAFTAICANAQDDASKWYAGGGIGFSSVSQDGESTTTISISPEIGYRFNDKWGLGISLGYGTTGSGDNKYTNFNIRPYVRQDLVKFGKASLILDYSVWYQSAGRSTKTNTFGIGVIPGLAVNVNSQLSIVTQLGAGIGYESSKLDVEGAKAENTLFIGAQSTNRASFSIYYNF